jgi:glycine dehydrogenase
MQNEFQARHIGPRATDLSSMLQTIGVNSLDQLIEETVPANIRLKHDLNIGAPQTEYQYLQLLKEKAAKNKVCKNYIGLGYYGTITPGVIQRNIFRKSGLVHTVHAISGRNCTRPTGSIAELPNDD